jgi:hypothetical protein
MRILSLYDARKNFLLDELNIERIINLRKNAVPKARGSYLRKKEVLLMKRVGREGWMEEGKAIQQQMDCSEDSDIRIQEGSGR